MRTWFEIVGLLALGAVLVEPCAARADVCVQVVDVVVADVVPDDEQPEPPAAPSDDEESPEPEPESPEPESEDDSSKDGKERLRHDDGAGADLHAHATLAQWRRDFEGALRADQGHQGLPDKPPRA